MLSEKKLFLFDIDGTVALQRLINLTLSISGFDFQMLPIYIELRSFDSVL